MHPPPTLDDRLGGAAAAVGVVNVGVIPAGAVAVPVGGAIGTVEGGLAKDPTVAIAATLKIRGDPALLHRTGARTAEPPTFTMLGTSLARQGKGMGLLLGE